MLKQFNRFVIVETGPEFASEFRVMSECGIPLMPAGRYSFVYLFQAEEYVDLLNATKAVENTDQGGLGKLCTLLGWQGGTKWQVLDEAYKRLGIVSRDGE